MQSVSSRIWTHVPVSISYDDNDYTTGTSKCEAGIRTTTCFGHLTWMVCEMGGKQSYNCIFLASFLDGLWDGKKVAL